MHYLVWQKTEFAEDWHCYQAEDEDELTGLILERTRKEGEVVVTVPIEYTVKVSISKPPAGVVPAAVSKVGKSKEKERKEGKVEVTEGGPEEDTVA